METSLGQFKVVEITQSVEGNLPKATSAWVEYTLDYASDFVGGIIQMPMLSEELEENNISMIINDEGKIVDGFVPTIAVINKGNIVDLIYGNVIFVGFNDESESVSLNEAQIQYIQDNIISKAARITSSKDTRDCFILQI